MASTAMGAARAWGGGGGEGGGHQLFVIHLGYEKMILLKKKNAMSRKPVTLFGSVHSVINRRKI